MGANKSRVLPDQGSGDHNEPPALRVIHAAEARARLSGSEVDGFLSLSHGFLPRQYPQLRLPAKWRAWDELGERLPDLMATLQLRHYIEKRLPTLSAAKLPERYLFRAALILGLSSHGYWYVGPHTPDSLPPALRRPWETVCKRLNRLGTYLSGEDVQLYNFHFQRNDTLSWNLAARSPREVESDESYLPHGPGFCMEDLQMLQGLWANRAETIFHLAFCEMAAAAQPLCSLAIQAQRACMQNNPHRLQGLLWDIADAVQRIQAAFMKVGCWSLLGSRATQGLRQCRASALRLLPPRIFPLTLA